MDLSQISKIEYHFSDSSTPPRYHRSYDIVVSPDAVKVIVDSYGTVLADENYSINSSDFDKLIRLVKHLDSPNRFVTDASGTKGYTISLYKGEEQFYKLHWDSLSKNKVSQHAQDFVENIKALVPNLSELRERPLPETDNGE